MMNGRILVVDDDPLMLQALLTLGPRLGAEIQAAGSGSQALEMIRTSPLFDLIVSDFEMPGMDGLELLQRCRDETPATVRVMLSGATVGQAIQLAVREGLLFRFIPKPCSLRRLAVHLEAALNEAQAALVPC